MEVVHDVEKVGGRLPLLNPWPVPQGLIGIAPPRIDHVLVHAEEVNEMTHFMQTCFDFHLTEQVLTGEGHMMGAFLQRSGRPHDIAIIQGPNGALHHFSFWLDDWDHVRRAADILAYNAISIDIGPTRHGITRGNTIYFFDPMGTRNEVFTGGYRADPDFPDDHVDRGQPRPGDLLLRGQGQRSLPHGAHLMSGHPAPVARRGPRARPRAGDSRTTSRSSGWSRSTAATTSTVAACTSRAGTSTSTTR